ncbi:hypothetical protein DV736_g3133, partial [Chaetothyriales sp. CBS 134916]
MQCQQLPSRYYNHGEAVFMRRTENGLSLPLSQSYSGLDHFDSNTRLSRRNTPAADTDKPGAAPRKRVPVACERCRKRKIKCSGDEGGSCVNCRNAGVASVDPNIFRAMRGGTVWQGSHRYTPYPTVYKSHHPSSQSAYSTYVSNSYSNQELSVGLDYTYPIPSHSSAWPRSNSYPPPYSPYEEQPTASYSSQANPAFLLPNSDPMTAGSTCPANPYLKTPLNQLLHESSAQLPSSQPISHLVTTSYQDSVYDQAVPYSAMGNSAQAAFKGEQSSGYQSICIPQPPLGITDRTLPNPSRQFSACQMSTIDSLPTSAGAISHRSSLGWMTGSSSSSRSSGSSGQNSCMSNSSQDLRYNMVGSVNSPTSLPPTSAAISTSDLVNSQSPVIPQLSQQQECRTAPQESLEESSDSHQSHYGCTGSLVIRPSHTKNTSAQATNGDVGDGVAAYPRPQVDLTQNGSTGADECVADCSPCTTSTSTRVPLVAIRNQLVNY